MDDLNEMAKAADWQRRLPPPPARAMPGWAIAGVVLAAAAALVGTMIYWTTPAAQQWMRTRERENAAHEQRAGEDRAHGAEQAEAIKRRLDDLVAKHALVRSIDYEDRIMRVDPAAWTAMDVQEKRDLVQQFHAYYELRGKDSAVEVRSSKNDRVFAESDHGGLAVHE